MRRLELTLLGVLAAWGLASLALSCLDTTKVRTAPEVLPSDAQLAAACEAAAPKGPELPTPVSGAPCRVRPKRLGCHYSL